MKNLIRTIIAVLCVLVLLPQAQAASKGKVAKISKENLVLMPMHLPAEDRNLQGAMETALLEGLQKKYEVFTGDKVDQRRKEVFAKESKKGKLECDETKCLQDIAAAFNSELLATATVAKQDGGYFLAINIRNLFDDKVVYSKSLPCDRCTSFQVVDKLKELVSVPVTVASVVAEAQQAKVNQNDPDAVLWAEAQKGNSAEDYQVYIDTYPKGKYLPFAKARIKKLKDEAQAAAEQQEQQAWDTAQKDSSEDSYMQYLKGYPQGRFAGLAKVRLDKLKNDVAAREEAAQWKAVQASEDSQTAQNFLNQYPRSAHLAAAQERLATLKKAEAELKPGKVFKDCAECPEMVVVPAGSFTMGSNKGGDESPSHSVTIAKAFALGKIEITQGQWKAVMGSNPSNFKNCGDNCPLEKVNWDEAKEFIQKLNAKTGKQYRLPSEAEWEYTCRAGGQNEYCGSDDVDSIAWYGRKAGDTTQPSARKQVNAFGLYDMSGNVWEWIEDNYHANYNGAPTDGSVWQGGDSAKRVLRGGSWLNIPDNSRFAFRGSAVPAVRGYDVGFRVARTLP